MESRPAMWVVALALLVLPGPAAAHQDECTWMVECGCGPEYALAGQVRERELTAAERTAVAGCRLAYFEYMLGALEVVRSTPGATRATLPPQSEETPIRQVLHSLLNEVIAHGQPRTEWIEQTWHQHKLHTHFALIIWRQGVLHPLIAELAAADGYNPRVVTYCGGLCTYFRIVAAEPGPLPEKVLYHLSRENAETTPGYVRLFELGTAGTSAALQLYHQGWPGVAPVNKSLFTDRLYHLLVNLGDGRTSEINPNDRSEQARKFTQAVSEIPLGKRSLKKSLAYLAWRSYMELVVVQPGGY